MANPEHPRLIIHDFLSLDLCKELEFIHKSCGTVGYRPNVFSTTLSHLIATNCGHLIMPFVPIRERLKEKAEEFFGCEFELFVEFTGLIRACGAFGVKNSWSTGASIGWHSDDNRPYLKQRDFAAVCYLNSHGEDFEGGLFHFQDWQPTTIVPMAGDVVMYTADSRNIHSVDEAVQFYCWKASELQTSGHEKRINVVPLSPSQREEVNRLKHVFLKDERVPDKLFSSAMGNERSQQPFNWAHVSAAVTAWEAYSNKLVKEMLLSLPYWKTHQSIFSVPSFDLGK
ncbi:uncharacterized protein LOC131300789 isoform X6 [Rhododendron vialii]|uniref:uncharacterized protein LOC131300789 isoform X6 n=1 Tax=Rhododendron vialii TaxID=182163 RepID=UPI00265EECB6|nr:uncharacterized protein LOC131300789 isoform X6 [Rhododendron vialii]